MDCAEGTRPVASEALTASESLVFLQSLVERPDAIMRMSSTTPAATPVTEGRKASQ